VSPTPRPASPTAVAAGTPTTGAAGRATATPDLGGPGFVPEPDPVQEAQRTVVATVGDGGLGDRAARLLNDFYPLVTRAYAENKPELLRPYLDDDAYAGYVRDIRRSHTEPEVGVPVIAYRIQPRVLSNLGPKSYAINVAEVRYDRDINPKTGKGIRTSRPYRDCARWYLIEVGPAMKIEGGTSIPERFCDAGWPDPPIPSKE
jgi:hypothetical protein